MNALKLSVVLALATPIGFAAGTVRAAVPAGMTQMVANQPHAQVSMENQKQIDELTKAYLSTQRLLVQDKFDGVTSDFAKIQSQAKDLAQSDNTTLAKKAAAVADAVGHEPKNLKTARTRFKKISSAVFDLLKIAPASTSVANAVYQMHCPMAQADWLQESKDVANPYLGQNMPTCGTLQHTIQGRSN